MPTLSSAPQTRHSTGRRKGGAIVWGWLGQENKRWQALRTEKR
jgi:hypothetical protein